MHDEPRPDERENFTHRVTDQGEGKKERENLVQTDVSVRVRVRVRVRVTRVLPKPRPVRILLGLTSFSHATSVAPSHARSRVLLLLLRRRRILFVEEELPSFLPLNFEEQSLICSGCSPWGPRLPPLLLLPLPPTSCLRLTHLRVTASP